MKVTRSHTEDVLDNFEKRLISVENEIMALTPIKIGIIVLTVCLSIWILYKKFSKK